MFKPFTPEDKKPKPKKLRGPAKHEADRVKLWQRRIDAANRLYTEWEDEYLCQQAEDYYYGHQWDTEIEDEQHYTINMIWPTVEIKLPSLMFYRPQVIVKPRPGFTDEPETKAADRAKLQQDTVNTFIQDRKFRFKPETALALKESQWRFGVVEVGYTGDFIDNPNAGKPVLKEDGEEMYGKDGNRVLNESKIFNPDNPNPESLFIRRIPAKHWRVSVSDKNATEDNDWVGYYTYQYAEDLKRNPNYKNTDDLETNAHLNASLAPSSELLSSGSDDEDAKFRDLVKTWKIWSIREKKRYVWADNSDKFLLEGEPYDNLPFGDIRHHQQTDSWYPVPPLFNLLSLQDELNETREMQRVHRRRFYRRYMADENIPDTELEKLETGGDGTIIKVPRAQLGQGIVPIQDAPLDGAVARNIPQTKQDFMEVSSVGSEQRGEASGDITATQANIVETRAQLRESYGRGDVAEWLSILATLMLQNLSSKMALEFWVKRNVDSQSEGALEEALRIAGLVMEMKSEIPGAVLDEEDGGEKIRVPSGETWKKYKRDDLGDINMEVSVDVESLSPLGEVQERDKFFQGLTAITNPAFAPILTVSDTLLRKALGYFGIKTRQEVNEIKKAIAINMIMQAQAAQASKAATGNGGGGMTATGPAPTPEPQDIMGQLEQQMPTEVPQ